MGYEEYKRLFMSDAPSMEDMYSGTGTGAYAPMVAQYSKAENDALNSIRATQGNSISEALAQAFISSIPALVGGATGGKVGAAYGGLEGAKYGQLFSQDLMKGNEVDRQAAKEELKSARESKNFYQTLGFKEDTEKRQAIQKQNRDAASEALRMEDMDRRETIANNRISADKDIADKRITALENKDKNNLSEKELGEMTETTSRLQQIPKHYDISPSITLHGDKGDQVDEVIIKRDLQNDITDRIRKFIIDVGPVMSDIETNPKKRALALALQNDLLEMYAKRPEAKGGFRKDERFNLLSGTAGVTYADLTGKDTSWLQALSQAPLLHLSKDDALGMLTDSYRRNIAKISREEKALGLTFVAPPQGADPSEWDQQRSTVRDRQIEAYQRKRLGERKTIQDMWQSGSYSSPSSPQQPTPSQKATATATPSPQNPQAPQAPQGAVDPTSLTTEQLLEWRKQHLMGAR